MCEFLESQPDNPDKKCVDSTETSALVAEEDAEMHRRPPLEPELGALTLWPETEKVFGHGYEVTRWM